MILDESLILKADQEKITLTDKEIFTKIWFSPRLVFRYLEQNSYSKFGPILLVLAGISSGIDRSISRSAGDSMSLWAVLAIAVVAGGLLGWISYYIYAALISWTGSWIKGTSDTSSILRVLAHALIPSIASLAILFAQIGVFGNGLFQSYSDLIHDLPLQVFYYFTLFISAVLSIWTLVLLIIGVSEVQKFSIGKAILNVLLPVLLFLIPIAIIAFVLGDLFR